MKINLELNCGLNKRTSRSSVNNCLVSERGMVLVLTLMILAIITAMVVEFSYGVYTTTSSLYNWRDSQKLSFVAKSGVSLAVKIMSDIPIEERYKLPGKIEYPIENIIDGFSGNVVIKVEDENSKFNLNSIVNPDGSNKSYDSFKKLLKKLELDETIADRIADWIDKGSQPRLRDSEQGAKDNYLDSIDELLIIKGIDEETYEKLLPYVTVYATEGVDNPSININTAPIPVIMSLDKNITEELAQRIVDYREITPFGKASDIMKVAGFESLGQFLMGKLVPQASNYRIKSIAEENKIKRIIECVIGIKGSSNTVKYWKEM